MQAIESDGSPLPAPGSDSPGSIRDGLVGRARA